MTFDFDAPLWLWETRASSWTFVSLPAEASQEVREVAAPVARGFGSLRVEVTVGPTTWRTSIVPDPRSDRYVLPVKRAVRAAAGVAPGDTVHVRVVVLDL